MTRTQVHAAFVDIGLALDGLRQRLPGPGPIHEAFTRFVQAQECFDGGHDGQVRGPLLRSLVCARAVPDIAPVILSLEALLTEFP